MDITDTPKTPLLGMDLAALGKVAAELGLPRFTAGQMFDWLYRKGIGEIDEMSNISLGGRALIKGRYCVGMMGHVDCQRSVDGTVKYLFRTAGGKMIESVYIPDADRATLCVSSQIGCKMNCSFCMTGKQGYHGDLTAAEILNQIFSIPESLTLTNIVFMGMGEPMDNYSEVVRAIAVLTERWGLAWSPKRITVSSIGKLGDLKRLVEQTDVHIAISVHSPYHEERKRLMPVENAFPIKKVMTMLRDYDFAHQRRLSVEYIMWAGLNDDEAHADALAKLLEGQKVRVNLIRFHAIPGSELKTSDERRMTAFRDRLNSLGVTCTIRRSRGEDIMAACGMLAGRKLKDNK